MALPVFSHLYYALILEHTTSAHLAENKTYNYGDNGSTYQLRECGILLQTQIGAQAITQNPVLLHQLAKREKVQEPPNIHYRGIPGGFPHLPQ